MLCGAIVLAACSREPVKDATTATTESTTTIATTTREPAPPAPSSPAPPVPGVEGPKLAFVDEGAKDPSFAKYRQTLLAAVKARDAAAVAALADPRIRTSFGEGGGREELKKLLARPDMFAELEQILTLGGTFQEESFWAPYVYSAFPDSEDAFETLAVIGDDVALRSEPSATAPAVATLAHDLVRRAGKPGAQGEWQQVKTADGRSGYVESKFVRSPIGYRAGFLKQNGQWVMNALVSGD